MSSKPNVYCCFPRPGIIFMSFVFGCFGLCLYVPELFSSESYHISCLKGFLNFIKIIISVTSTFAFFYSTYLAYKRKYKHYIYLLYIFWVDILVQGYDIIIFLKNLSEIPASESDMKVDVSNNAAEGSPFTEEEYIKFFQTIGSIASVLAPFIIAFIVLFPFLNKLYFVIKLKSYVDYVTYKKEEVDPVKPIGLPHKLPECSQ